MPKKGYRKPGAKKDSIRQRRYNSTPKQLKRRAIRNSARARAVKSGRIRKGDGKDIDHKDRRGLSYGSTQVLSVHKNRGKNSPLWKRRHSKKKR